MTDTSMTHDAAPAHTETKPAANPQKAGMPPPIKPSAERDPLRARIENFSFYYANGHQAIKHVDMPYMCEVCRSP